MIGYFNKIPSSNSSKGWFEVVITGPTRIGHKQKLLSSAETSLHWISYLNTIIVGRNCITFFQWCMWSSWKFHLYKTIYFNIITSNYFHQSTRFAGFKISCFVQRQVSKILPTILKIQFDILGVETDNSLSFSVVIIYLC